MGRGLSVIKKTASMLAAMALIMSFGLQAVYADEDFELQTEDDSMVLESEDIEQLSVMASGDEGNITVVWSEASNASYYQVCLDDDKKIEISANDERACVFRKASNAMLHSVTVRAYSEDVLVAEGYAGDIKAEFRSKLKNTSVKAKDWGVNLKDLMDETDYGHAVTQGAATDGKYAYYLMNCSDTENGRVLKMDLKTRKVVKKGPIINTHHGNGVTFDTKRNLLVANGHNQYKQQLTFIDPETLTITEVRTVSYPYKIKGLTSEKAYDCGIASIAYVKEYDVYVARVQGYYAGSGDANSYYADGDANSRNHLWVFDAETLNAIGHINTDIQKKYPMTYQDMDADSKYVYILVSPGENRDTNIILVLDWNSEMLLPVMNGDAEYVDTAWSCNNNGSGLPDAVVTIPLEHETEGLFYVTEPDGRQHFYLTEFYGRNVYKTVKTTETYQVKWKQVWKKVKYKKVNGKWKYKKKKVWLYKTKTRTVKKKVKVGRLRDDYAFDIGII